MQATIVESNAKQLQEEDALFNVVRMAMRKTDVSLETDLSEFIPYGNGSLPRVDFMKLKDSNKPKLTGMIRENIIEKSPRRLPPASPNLSKAASLIQNNLKNTVERAMQKVAAEKESDLCSYISYNGKRLHHYTYNKMKRDEPNTVVKLIKDHILDRAPVKLMKKYQPRVPKESPQSEQAPAEQLSPSLERVIDKAMRRRSLKIKKEEDICRFLPNGNRFLHPLAYRKLKAYDPDHLRDMIETHVLIPKSPKRIEWSPEGSSHSKDQKKASLTVEANPVETQDDQSGKIDQLMEVMSRILKKLDGDLPAKKSSSSEEPFAESQSQTRHQHDRYLRTIQNQLVKRIRNKEVDYELWDSYVDLVDGNK